MSLKQVLGIVDFCFSASDSNLLAAVYPHSLFVADNVLKQYKIQHIYNRCFFFSIFFYVVLVLFVL